MVDLRNTIMEKTFFFIPFTAIAIVNFIQTSYEVKLEGMSCHVQSWLMDVLGIMISHPVYWMHAPSLPIVIKGEVSNATTGWWAESS